MAALDNPLSGYQVELVKINHVQRASDHDTGWRSLPLLLALEVRKGRFECEVRDVGTIVLDRAGVWILLAPEQWHRIRVPEGDGPATTRWTLLQASTRDGRSVFSDYRFPQKLSGKSGLELSRSMDSIFRQRKQASPAATCETQAAAYHLMALLFRYGEKVCEPSPRWKELSPVLVRIRQHLNEPWDRVRMADLAALSPARFDQVFKEVIGMTPSRWLQFERVTRAKKLMLSTDLPVYEIAALVGFEDPYHFSRFFKRHEGCSPNQWRISRIDS